MSELNKLSIKKWSEDDRPREKLMSKGVSSLSDAELIAIIIGSGSRTESAVELSKRILVSVQNNLNSLGQMDVVSLMKYKGIGEAKAISIVATLELGKRRAMADVLQRISVKSSNDVFQYFQPLIADLPHEEFWILCLNQANKVIDRTRISQGGLTSTIIDIRIILKLAIEKLATALVLCHNHPSGSIIPSDSDHLITNKLKEAGLVMDIIIVDHIIIGNDTYYSFADEGLL